MEKIIETEWDINWDGYYPYCKKCEYEPFEYAHTHNGELPEYCPKCGAKMKNYLEFKREN